MLAPLTSEIESGSKRSKRHEQDASVHQAFADLVVQAMPSADGATTALVWTLDGFGAVLEETVLLKEVRRCGTGSAGSEEVSVPTSGAEIQRVMLRAMRLALELASASQGQGHHEQRADELADALRELSQHLALEGSAGQWKLTTTGSCWELPISVRHTSAIGSGLWLPTPCTVDTGSMFNRSDSEGAALRPTLGAMAKHSLWPTPIHSEARQGLQIRRDGKKGTQQSLSTAVATWPTPHGFSPDGQSNGPSGNELGRAVNQSLRVATPTARDWRSGLASQATHDRNSRPLSEQIGGSLNPDWVERLMNWPAGWTSLQPLATAEMRGWGEGWEDGVPRVATGVPQRVQRLKCIGNGQVPLCAATAWRMLAEV